MWNIPDQDMKLIETKFLNAIQYREKKPRTYQHILDELGIREAL